jgi:hypothetical protein
MEEIQDLDDASPGREGRGGRIVRMRLSCGSRKAAFHRPIKSFVFKAGSWENSPRIKFVRIYPVDLQ